MGHRDLGWSGDLPTCPPGPGRDHFKGRYNSAMPGRPAVLALNSRPTEARAGRHLPVARVGGNAPLTALPCSEAMFWFKLGSS